MEEAATYGCGPGKERVSVVGRYCRGEDEEVI